MDSVFQKQKLQIDKSQIKANELEVELVEFETNAKIKPDDRRYQNLLEEKQGLLAHLCDLRTILFTGVTSMIHPWFKELESALVELEISLNDLQQKIKTLEFPDNYDPMDKMYLRLMDEKKLLVHHLQKLQIIYAKAMSSSVSQNSSEGMFASVNCLLLVIT
jgi:hypothetical protein